MSHTTDKRTQAVLTLVTSLAFMAVLTAIAHFTARPFVFPALGASAFLLVTTPSAPQSSLKNVAASYAIAIACGWGSMWLFGLADRPPDAMAALGVARALAVGTALGLTGALMIVLDVRHPPASAATVMIALGVMREPIDLAVVELAALLLAAMAMGVHALHRLTHRRPA
ncbi:HPP family protein [Myxococcota bacterium]|nr:HPP family protein [Myxococcota bacterium]